MQTEFRAYPKCAWGNDLVPIMREEKVLGAFMEVLKVPGLS